MVLYNMNNIILILFFCIFSFLLFNNIQSNPNNKQYVLQEELEKKINKLTALLDSQKKQQQNNNDDKYDKYDKDDKDYKDENYNKTQIIVPPNRPDIVDIRDINTVENPMYPLYGRTERPIIDMLMTNKMFNYRTRGSEDTYHPVAYAKERGTENIYYLMGRQRYQGSSQGDFYLIPTDTNNRLKINLTDRSGNQILKDIYNVPDELKINYGIFNGKTFDIEQLKNTDLISPYY